MLLFVILIIILASIIFTLLSLRRAVARNKNVPSYVGEYPSVTIVRPVKGLDVNAQENFRIGLCTGYPGEVQTLFVFEDKDDPAYEVARKVVEEYKNSGGKDDVQILFSGAVPKTRTGKLHNMIVGEAHAKNALIAFCDSDTRPDQNVLRILVETLLSKEHAGAAFMPAVSDQPIEKAGDVFYALLQNAMYAPWALLAAGSNRTLPFIMGQYMIFTRECLRRIGGVACATGQLVDDMYIGRVVHEKGMVNAIAPYRLSLISTGLTFRSFIPVYRKWFQFGRNGLSFSFLWRQWLFGFHFYASLAVLIFALVQGSWWLAAMAMLVLAVFSFGLTFLNRGFGGARIPLRYFWAPSALFILSLIILIHIRINKTVNWRGREYKLDDKAALNPEAD